MLEMRLDVVPRAGRSADELAVRLVRLVRPTRELAVRAGRAWRVACRPCPTLLDA
jgi:hypothetical protein